MNVSVSARLERVRSSLFFVPMVFVVAGIVMGELGLLVDQAIGTPSSGLPLGLTSTVESARAVLSTVAGATMTVAGIAFSVSLLTIQLASSQFSPRVVSGLFRDPFNKRVIGVVVGTFAYCLVVLRAVRSPLDKGGEAVIPNVSVAIAVLLGITAVLMIVAFINHHAHSMDISEILARVRHDAIEAVDRHWSTDVGDESVREARPVPTTAGTTVRFDQDGWVQLLDHDALLRVVSEHGTIRFETAVGRFAMCGAPLCTMWPPPDDIEEAERVARIAVHVGPTRTMRQDGAYGVRQLVDVALRALSPGVNDPTTAQDAIFQLAAVLRVFLDQTSPSAGYRVGTRQLVFAQADGHEALIALAYDEIRVAAATNPTVCIYLLESMSLLEHSLLLPVDPTISVALRTQARLVLDGLGRTEPASHDLDRVVSVFTRHFDD